MTRCKKEEKRKRERKRMYARITKSERERKKRIARNECTRRRNQIPQIDEVDEEGAVPTAAEEEAGNDVGGISIGRSK